MYLHVSHQAYAGWLLPGSDKYHVLDSGEYLHVCCVLETI